MNAWMSENKQYLKKVLHVRAGLMVTERNWLEVYPYTKWGGNDSLPHLQEGQTFMPSHLMLKEVNHVEPPLYCSATITSPKAYCMSLTLTAFTAAPTLQGQQTSSCFLEVLCSYCTADWWAGWTSWDATLTHSSHSIGVHGSTLLMLYSWQV